MYKILTSLIFILFMVSTLNSQSAQPRGAGKNLKKASGSGEYVDIVYSNQIIAGKKKNIEKLNAHISKLTGENSKSQNIITQSKNTISRIEALIKKFETEKDQMENLAKDIVDTKTSDTNSKSLSTCNDNILKLSTRKGELDRLVKMHEQKIVVNKKKIDENNGSINILNGDIKHLETSIGKTEGQRKNIDSHKSSVDSLTKEAEALLKSNTSAPKK